MKAGDRVKVIAPADEYSGFSGEVVEVTAKGDLVVDIEIPQRWRAVFKPNDVELDKPRRPSKGRPLMDIPQEFVRTIYCRGCGTPHGRGVSVRVVADGGPNYSLTISCLRCGRSGFLRVVSSLPLPATAVEGPDISSDEVIDLHEAMKSPDWLANLIGQK